MLPYSIQTHPIVALILIAIIGTGWGLIFLFAFRVLRKLWFWLPFNRSADPGRPRSIKRLVLSKQELRIDKPFRLVGKPDEVYLNKQGRLVPVDTKTRRRPVVHLSDAIQLSAYRMLLTHASHHRLPTKLTRRVADYGYIRLVVAGQVTWQRVSLMNETDVVLLARRRAALEQGKTAPRYAQHPGLCQCCRFRDVCSFGRHVTKN